MSSCIIFEKGHDRRVTYLPHGSSLSNVLTFAGQLEPYSRAAIVRVSCTLKQALTGSESSGEYATTDLYAVLKMEDLDSDEKYAVIVPAPIDSMFEAVSDRGFRVKQAHGEQITNYYAVLSGLNLEFRDGWLCGSGP